MLITIIKNNTAARTGKFYEDNQGPIIQKHIKNLKHSGTVIYCER